MAWLYIEGDISPVQQSNKTIKSSEPQLQRQWIEAFWLSLIDNSIDKGMFAQLPDSPLLAVAQLGRWFGADFTKAIETVMLDRVATIIQIESGGEKIDARLSYADDKVYCWLDMQQCSQWLTFWQALEIPSPST